MTNSTRCRDDVFGPLVPNCPQRFDFTLLFEDTILSILPSCFFLLFGIGHFLQIYKRTDRVAGRYFRWTKFGFLTIYGLVEVIFLAVWAKDQSIRNSSSIAAASLSAACAVLLCGLSIVEHSKTIRPSTVLVVYLGFTTLFDAAKLRTLWIIHPHMTVTLVATISISLKGFTFLLESMNKSRYLLPVDAEKSPEETCGIINLGFSIWVNSILLRGARTTLSSADLYDLGSSMSANHLEASFIKHWTRLKAQGQNQNTILWCCGLTLRWSVLSVVPIRLALLALTVCQPVLMQSLLTYLQEPIRPSSRSVGNGLIGAYVIVYLGMAISNNLYWYYHLRTMTKLRACLVGAIGRHATTVNANLLEDSQSALTLMSNDVELAVNGTRFLHDIWANTVQAVLATYILQRQAGAASAVSVGVTILTSIAVMFVSGKIGSRQPQWMEAVQNRVAAISDMLSSMRGIKMKGLVHRYNDVVGTLRSRDIESGNRFRIMIAYIAALSFVPELLCPFLTFTVLVLAPNISGSTFDAARIFTILSSLIILTQPLTNVIQLLPGLVAAVGSLRRIGAFVMSDEQLEFRSLEDVFAMSSPGHGSSGEPQQHFARIQTGIAAAEGEQSDTLTKPPAFKSVSGSFRWGNKPDALHDLNITIPQEMLTLIVGPVASGKTTLCETLLGQTQLSSGNIKMWVPATEFAYCSQTPHLANTSIKDNITTCSAYDPAFYAEVMCATGLLKEVSEMPNRDNTIVGSKGAQLSGGQRQRLAIARAIYARKKVVIFDDVLSGLDKTNARHIITNVIGPNGLLRKHGATVIFATHSLQYLSISDHVVALGSNGTVLKEGYYTDILSIPGYEKIMDTIDDGADSEPSAPKNNSIPVSEIKSAQPTQSEVKTLQTSELSVYAYYAKAAGSLAIILLVFFSISVAVFFNYSTLWLKRWADYSSRFGDSQNDYFLGIYTTLQCLTVVFLFLVAYQGLTHVTSHSGGQLHATLLRTVLNAPYACLTAIDSGEIINRFSQDIQLVDTELPLALMNFMLCLVSAIGQGLLITISSPYTSISFPPFIALLYYVQKFYLKTSKQIRMLDLEAKSPLYTIFLDTFSGLSTIRAFGWTQQNQEKLLDFLDQSQKPFYFLFIIQQWLSFVLELVVAVIAIIIVALAVALNSRSSSAGVALIQVITFNGMLRQLIVSWTQMETSIGAVSRIKDFSEHTESETDQHGGSDAEPGWPSEGKLELKSVSAAYQPNDMVLQNIDLAVSPGEKIGLCGRSGSGKSSLALSLFAMTELQSGNIMIDGVDLRTLSLNSIRMRLNSIPQDPVFIPGSVRLNLRPPGAFEDLPNQELIEVLRKVKLWDLIEENGGLDVALKPTIFSHGQKQLFSLAGSLLRPSKVVVLDEFTSSVDAETDALMQQLIREHFSSSTIIAIAHRLNTILDFDRVVVLDDGFLVESGSPRTLLERGLEQSIFAKLVNTTPFTGKDR